ncbi:rRNA accumulation-related protein [Marasmius crinis-equi]|uniref:rRNA accumulation-related protein n=1 Tax=Marasmius crinis-equi TaxID=585013 RepID=A0ABR3FZ38_9AGAR
MSSSTSSTTTIPATTVLFTRGVIARLSTWPILRSAIQESWGGPNTLEKTKWLYGTIVDTFEQEKETPDDQYIEELLLQVLSDEFDVVVEDGSAESVAKDVVVMWDEVHAGRGESLVQKWEEKADKLKGKKEVIEVQQADDEEWEDDDGEEDDDDDDMDEDEEPAPQLIEHQPKKKEEPQVDEDGFTLVKGKGRR